MITDLEVKQLTEELRNSDEPMWRRIRQLLADQDIDPLQSALAYFTTEAPYYEFGVVVAGGNKIYQFAFDYLNMDVTQGTFAEWNDITAEAGKKPYREQIALACDLLEKMK